MLLVRVVEAQRFYTYSESIHNTKTPGFSSLRTRAWAAASSASQPAVNQIRTCQCHVIALFCSFVSSPGMVLPCLCFISILIVAGLY